ncbi:MAG: zinc ribbon domain-containing protein [Promethearchaeota archaeon]|nr:MAG: zinc ribbon domain-containing protein [Candidatus Lokiarchaeota archaeon]
MGWGRVIKSGIVGMLIFVPMAYISFRFLNLTEGVTGGLIVNIDDAISSLTGFIDFGGFFIEFLAGMLIGVVLVFAFPIHWCIMYRPEDWLLIIAITFPWILSCVITNALFSHSPREAIHTSLSMGIGYAIISVLFYIILVVAIPLGLGSVILDGLMLGLTDLPFLLAVLTAILEGCLVGTVFGAFIGSLRYKPKGVKEKKKKVRVKVKEETTETTEMFPREEVEEEPISTSYSDYCTNCGAKLTADDLFCTNCGSKK